MKQSYRDLRIWQESINLATDIVKLTQPFPPEHRFGLADQLRRAAISVSLNIAEGCGQLTKPGFVRFLGIARGSVNETVTCIELATTCDLLSDVEKKKLLIRLDKLGKQLNSLINSLRH
ncbi:four helix bundle protein [Candidatus Dojkabacteria bacterium]|nr:four helix bundle protein [Candidatus Dojkabacteria bacterium]